MSVTSSRLRHHGVPGLQAQKWVSTENTRATAIVMGTTLVIVWPSISTTSRGRLDMSASSDQVASRVTCPCLRSDEAVAADAVAAAAAAAAAAANREPEQHRICADCLITNLLCLTTAILIEVYAVELTAPQFSDLRVTHGHGAENAGETKLYFNQPRVHMEL